MPVEAGVPDGVVPLADGLVDIRRMKAVARRLPVGNVYRAFLEGEPDLVPRSRLKDYLTLATIAVPRFGGMR